MKKAVKRFIKMYGKEPTEREMREFIKLNQGRIPSFKKDKEKMKKLKKA